MKLLYTDNTILSKDRAVTFLSADAASGASSLTVQSIAGFASLTTSSGQIIMIGELGNQYTEILKTSSTTVASGTTVTLNSTTQFAHPQDTKIYIVDWDRVDAQWSLTTSGTKSTIRAYPAPIQPAQTETIVTDTTQTAGYYFVRFNETITNTNSDWSDPIPFAGYDDDTVWAIKKRALDAINEKIDTELITNDFLNNALWEGRREYHHALGKRPFRKIMNFSAGTVTAGQYRVLMPTNVEAPYTAENVYGVRIGVNPNMSYYDKKQWDQDMQGVAHTTLTTAYAVGNQDLYCGDVREFAASGSVSLENDTISYSAVGVSGGTLRISTQGATSHAVGIDVWQGVTFGLPGQYTVFADTAPAEFSFTGSVYVYFNVPISNTYVNQDIWMDYYSKILGMDSDADTLDEPDFDMYVYYLAWRIKQRKNKGLDPLTDAHYQLWQQRKALALSKEYLGTDVRISPDVGHLPISSDNRSLW